MLVKKIKWKMLIGFLFVPLFFYQTIQATSIINIEDEEPLLKNHGGLNLTYNPVLLETNEPLPFCLSDVVSGVTRSKAERIINVIIGSYDSLTSQQSYRLSKVDAILLTPNFVNIPNYKIEKARMLFREGVEWLIIAQKKYKKLCELCNHIASFFIFMDPASSKLYKDLETIEEYYIDLKSIKDLIDKSKNIDPEESASQKKLQKTTSHVPIEETGTFSFEKALPPPKFNLSDLCIVQ